MICQLNVQKKDKMREYIEMEAGVEGIIRNESDFISLQFR